MLKTNKSYYLLLFDIKDSTKLSSNKAKEKYDHFEKSIMLFNKQLNNDIALPISINYGDEIAGLFTSPRPFYQIVSKFRQIVYPETIIRFVAVKGKVTVASNDMRQVGGTIFKTANNEMSRLKKEERFCWWGIDKEPINESLTALCEVSDLLLNEMSVYQRSVFMLLSEGLNQKEIALKLNKYSQSIWDAIQRSKAEYIIRAENAIVKLLSEL